MTESPIVELSTLRTFSPLDGLKGENLRALEVQHGLRFRPDPGWDAFVQGSL